MSTCLIRPRTASLLTAFPVATFLHRVLHPHTDRPTSLVFGLCSCLCPDALLRSVAAPTPAVHFCGSRMSDCLFQPAHGHHDLQQELPMGASSLGDRTEHVSWGCVLAISLPALGGFRLPFSLLRRGKEKVVVVEELEGGGRAQAAEDAGGLLPCL